MKTGNLNGTVNNGFVNAQFVRTVLIVGYIVGVLLIAGLARA